MASEDNQQDDAQIEVTDLATGASYRHGAAPDARARPPLLRVEHSPLRITLTLDARRLRIMGSALALVLLSALIIGEVTPLRAGLERVFAFPERSTQGIPTLPPTGIPATSLPTEYPTPVAVSLQTIPTGCEESATTQTVGPAPTIGPGVGGDGVWVNGFRGPKATFIIGGGALTIYGFEQPITLTLALDFKPTVTLSGIDTTTGYPLWFNAANPPSGAPVTSYMITETQAIDQGASSDSTAVYFQMNMYLPGTGCYEITARWSGGGWHAFFAAGV
ncbi:MAG TPA: hypothetical protein VKQ36_04075 [Ktedonobacterales bacterium]|nr:hypothetical protein [Ktedonobacterales bacterium]